MSDTNLEGNDQLWYYALQHPNDLVTELGLDIFDALTALRNDTGCAAMAAGQPKIEVLLRERRQPKGGIIRARVERLTSAPEFYRRTEDAIKQVIENPPTTKFLTQKYNLTNPLYDLVFTPPNSALNSGPASPSVPLPALHHIFIEEMLIPRVHAFIDDRQHHGQQYKYTGIICSFLAVKVKGLFKAPEGLWVDHP
ncbi:hypothetical protein V8E54_003578 [Elaphomyces granulatus]